MEDKDTKNSTLPQYNFSMPEWEYFEASSENYSSSRYNEQSSRFIDNSKGYRRFKNEYLASFSWKFYFEFMFYHIMYFMVLGPLFVVFFAPFIGLPLIKNMGFFNLNTVCLGQTFIWVSTVAAVVAYFTLPEWDKEEAIVSDCDLYTILTLLLLRILHISSKYATFTAEKVAYFKRTVLTSEERKQDLIFGHWWYQTSEKIITELESAIKRHEIDSNLLYLYFITSPTPETQRLLAEKSDLILLSKTSTQSAQGAVEFEELLACPGDIQDPSRWVFGPAILYDLTERYQKKYSWKYYLAACILMVLIRATIPFIYWKSWDFGSIRLFTVPMAIFFVQNTYLYLQNSCFLIQSSVDMNRKIFIEKQLVFMCTPRKYASVEGDKKIYPTNNFLCPKNLKAWNLTRKICRDYGYRYYIRQSNNLASAAAIYGVTAVLLALFMLDVIGTSFDDEKKSVFMGIIGFDVAFFLFLVVKDLLIGIKLNKFYGIHKSNLEEINIFVADIARKTDWYFEKNVNPKNFLYQYAVNYFRKAYKDHPNRIAGISNQMEEILEAIKEIILDIEYEESHNAFTVLGFEPSYRLLSTLGIGIGSLVFAIVQFHLKAIHENSI